MKALLIAASVIAVIVLGFVFLRPPTPTIIVAPETIFEIASIEVTNTMFTGWVVVVLMVAIAVFAGRSMSLVPHGFSGAVEALVGGFFEFVEGIVGRTNARRFFPLVATIFLYVLFSNYFGLLPMNFAIGKTEPGHGETQPVFEQRSIAGINFAFIPLDADEIDNIVEREEGGEAAGSDGGGGLEAGSAPGGRVINDPLELQEDGRFSGLLSPYFRSVMTDVNAPLALALMSFVFVEYWGLSTLGLRYLSKFFDFGRLLKGNPMGLVDVFVGFLELISEFIRMVSFTFRLFGNIFAGEVLLLMMGFLVPLLLVNVFYGLELFVGLIQALVFAMLTLVFAQMAVTPHHDDEHEAAQEAVSA